MESFHDHLKFLHKKGLELRAQILKIINKAQYGFTGSALSVLDILITLYYGKLFDSPLLNFDAQKPGWPDQDYFVLSKAHTSIAWYVILADLGFFDMEELQHFAQINSLLQSRPVKKIPGAVIGSGIAGNGFSGAQGLAAALKMDRKKNRVFCILGDGELQEGQIWEGAMFAAHHKLDNFVAIVDNNGLQAGGNLRAILNIDSVADKFEAFGWKVIPVRDGHDFEELLSAFERALEVQRKPTVIIATTVVGKGVNFIENKPYYRSTALSDQELIVALEQLKIKN